MGKKWQEPGHYDKADRNKMSKGSFAGPHQSFPIQTQQDVKDAARLAGHAKNPAQVRVKIKEIAHQKGFNLPESWKSRGK